MENQWCQCPYFNQFLSLLAGSGIFVHSLSLPGEMSIVQSSNVHTCGISVHSCHEQYIRKNNIKNIKIYIYHAHTRIFYFLFASAVARFSVRKSWLCFRYEARHTDFLIKPARLYKPGRNVPIYHARRH